jgi:hypothetical protein
MAEIELSVLARQCLDRRIPDVALLKRVEFEQIAVDNKRYGPMQQVEQGVGRSTARLGNPSRLAPQQDGDIRHYTLSTI